MRKKPVSRRTFILGAAAAVSATATGEETTIKNKPDGVEVQSRKKKVRGPSESPNEKLNIAAVGCGNQGRLDIFCCQQRRENIAALCDVDWRNASGIFKYLPKAAKYRDFRVMLEKEKGIDAVIIATPDHMHATAAICAMELGKHVYVEKPLAYSVAEARLLRKVARRTGVATQMGNQGHSGRGVRRMCEMVWNGDLGQVHEVHIWTSVPGWPQGIERPEDTPPVPDTLDWDLWLGPAPYRPYHSVYHPGDWRGWRDFGTGALGDMCCHVADPANWALKLGSVGPLSVEAVKNEGMTSESYPKNAVIKYEFPEREGMDPVTVYWYDGGNKPKLPEGLPPNTSLGSGEDGSLFVGTKGMATADIEGQNPRLLPDALMADYKRPAETIPRVPDNDPYRDWIRACKGGPPACSNFDYSAPFTEWVLLGNLALRYSQKLEWDARNMRVTNLPEANEHLTRKYREGWDLGV